MKKKSENWLKTIFTFAKQCKIKVTLSVICAIISVLAGIIPYLCVYEIIKFFIRGEATITMVSPWIMGALIAYAVRFLFYGISTTLAHISAYTILESIRLTVASNIMKAPLGIVLNESIGKLKSILVDRVETIELPLAHMIPEGISNLLLPIGVFIYLVTVDYRMALVMLITIPIAMIPYAIMMKNFNVQYDNYMKSSAHLDGVIVEYVEGIEVIKAFNQSSTSYEKYEKAITSFKTDTLKWFRSTWKYMNFGNAVLPSTFLGTLPAGIIFYLNGTLSPDDFIMCLILSLGIVAPLMYFTVHINEMKSVEYAINDVKDFLDIPQILDTKEIVSLSNFDIELKNVSFSYNEASGVQVLSNINLKISQNKFSAIVGPSGSGKSTIAKLIARFWDIKNGEILIGKKNIKEISISQLADIVSFVTQDNFLFNCSIKENIRLGNISATDEEVYTAAKLAQCHDFITELEHGYDTGAGDAGNRLSGGEKQRIAIARMILKNAPIVILDEATAFCDPENEDKIQKSIKALTKDKTLLVIAHRLSTIKKADNIIVLNEGSIISMGSEEYLLSNCDLYQSMWKSHIGAKNWSVYSRKLTTSF